MKNHKEKSPEILEPEKIEPMEEIGPEKEEILPVVAPEEKPEQHMEIGTLNVFMPGAKTPEGLPQIAGGEPAPSPSPIRPFLLVFYTLLGVVVALTFGILIIPLLWKTLINPEKQILAASFSFPDKVVNEQPFEAKIVLKNTTKEIVPHGIAAPQWPPSFRLLKSDPEFSDHVWDLPPLAPNETVAISLSGIIASPSEEHHVFSLAISLEKDGVLTPLGAIEKKIVSRASGLSLDWLVNNQRDFIASLGDQLSYSIKFKNHSAQVLPEVRFEIDMQGPLFDLRSLKLSQGRLVGQKIIIDLSTLPLLKNIPPGAGGQIEFSLGVMPYVPDVLKVSSDPPLLLAKLNTFLNRGKGEPEVFSHETRVKINSDIGMLTQVRYFSPVGEEVGRGPLPPEVGAKTTYWIYFRAGNILNSLENATLTLVFADGDVGWTSREATSMGSEFLFDPFTRRASWVIGEIPANRSFALTPPSAQIEVFAVPSSDERGEIPLLLKEIVLSGRDSYTGEVLEKKYPPLDADLRFDERGRVKGYKVK